jgi:hypothetical protein
MTRFRVVVASMLIALFHFGAVVLATRLDPHLRESATTVA